MKKLVSTVSKLVVFCMVAVLLVACSAPVADSSQDAQGQSEQATEQATEEATEQSEQKKLRLTYVSPVIGHEFLDTIGIGAQQASEDLGGIFDIDIIGPKNAFNADEFVKDFYTAIASKPDGIIGYGYSDDLCTKPINDAIEAGIPVITVDCDAPSSNRLAFVGTSQKQAGIEAGKKMVELTGGNATVAIISSHLDLDALEERADGFKEAIADEPNMEVVVREGAPTLLDATQKAQEILLAYPEVNAFYGTDQDSVLGIANVLREKKLTDKIAVIGFDETDDILTAIKDGSIDATTIQQPYEMGYQVVELFKQYLIDGKEFDTVITNTPTIIATKENVDEFMDN